ncbi:MAG: protease inhibitor I42 family protein [Methanosarcinaceae archaeon]|nr:protease inhibitor I42 family protein [Methanosarcinaceae archaeon]
MKENKRGFLLLITVLSLSFVLISGCTDTENEMDSGEIPGADEQWKESEQPDTDGENDITGEEEVTGDNGDGVEPITVMFFENDSGSTANAIQGDTLIVVLEENPSTGYSWNLSASPGLLLADDLYEAGTDDEMTGAGGTHKWIFEVTGDEEQTIAAVYQRPWENVTGNERVFYLTINVIPEDKLIKANGSVNYIELEGGFYGITDKNGTHYDPVNLDEELKKEGLKICFTAYPLDNMVSIHMWGRTIEIRSAEITGR